MKLVKIIAALYALRGSVFGYSEEYGRDAFERLIFHAGQDFPWPSWTPIYCLGSGRVVSVGRSTDAGYFVVVIIGSRYHLMYHMAQPASVSVGDLVGFGTILGYVGMTGKVTGFHLHYAISNNPIPGQGTRVDPWPIIQQLLDANGATGAGGDFDIITEEEDMARHELRSTPDGTVWHVVDRVLRYALPNSAALERTKAYITDLKQDATINAEDESTITHFGSPVYSEENPSYVARRLDLTRLTAPAPDTAALAAALAAQLPGADTARITAALEAALADDFAKVNQNIDDQPTSFTISPS